MISLLDRVSANVEISLGKLCALAVIAGLFVAVVIVEVLV
jgi:hypothetical protein